MNNKLKPHTIVSATTPLHRKPPAARKARVLLAIITSTSAIGMLSLAGAATASASAPIALKYAGQIGREVNATETGKGPTAEDTCFVSTGDTCQPGKESTAAGGFSFAYSTAVDKTTSDVYVADPNNNRIEKFAANGEFLLMWGTDVNKKTEGNLCTAAEASECQAGKSGSEAGQMSQPQSVAVDDNGNVYVQDPGSYSKPNLRVDEFGPEGQFILMFGGEVNKKGGNVCTAAEAAECQAGKTGAANGFFQVWAQSQGNMIAVGGPEDLVYVADQGRIQEFDHNGAYRTQLSLATTTPAFPSNGKVTGLAVDAAGDVYMTESYGNYENEIAGSPKGVYEFAPGDNTAKSEIDTREEYVEGIALDGKGHLAVASRLPEYPFFSAPMEGTLFDLSGSAPPSKFQPPSGMGKTVTGLSFDGGGRLYLANPVHQDIEVYDSKVGAELTTVPGESCIEDARAGALVSVDCTLAGQLDAEGVSETEAWFRWGATSALGNETTRQKIANTKSEGEEETPVKVTAVIEGMRPNQTVYFDLAAFDRNFSAPEPLASPTESFMTRTVAPRVVGEPAASFIAPESVVLTGQVNPENASSEYFMEYGPGETLTACPGGIRKEACPGVMVTSTLQSAKYLTIAGTFEADGLAPSTTYRFRLNAVNTKGETAVNETGGSNLPEGRFTTAAPIVPTAETGSYSAVSATAAIVSGRVDPDGAPASYAFELGIYNPAAGTQYGVVQSGYAGEGSTTVGEQLQLAGLQPGTTYAYRIKVESAYGTSYGTPMTFTTQGLPAVIPIPVGLGFVGVPSIAFPKEHANVTTRKLTRAQKLENALHACRSKHNHRQRTACIRNAHRRYGPKPNKKARKK